MPNPSKSSSGPDGSTNTYVYDTLNRLSTLTNSLTGQFGFGYDALSRRTSLARPNSVSTNYTYDNLSLPAFGAAPEGSDDDRWRDVHGRQCRKPDKQGQPAQWG